jgi:DNA-directed RNA polymerase specialized sigma24 family protein
LVDGTPALAPYGLPVLEARVDHVYAAARAAVEDDDAAAEVTRRVLVADPHGPTDVLAARGACLAANRAPVYARIPPDDRDAVVLARVLGWKTDRIALQLGTTPADVKARLARGLRTLLLQPDCEGGASPAHGAHAS